MLEHIKTIFGKIGTLINDNEVLGGLGVGEDCRNTFGFWGA